MEFGWWCQFVVLRLGLCLEVKVDPMCLVEMDQCHY